MKIKQLVQQLRDWADQIDMDWDEDAEVDFNPNTYGISVPYIGTYDGFIAIKQPVYESDEYYESKQTKKEAVIRVPVKSFVEDTIKNKKGKWVNKGKEGTHGEFDTKKQADAQRRAMYASGFQG